LPEYTELTLPLALRLVDVVVEVYIGSWFGDVCSSPPATSFFGVSAACSSTLFWPFEGGIDGNCDSDEVFSGAGGTGPAAASSGSGASMWDKLILPDRVFV
jgi:hypothetical protein